MFSVNFWSSHPSLENDDCGTGEDYPTRREAEVAFELGKFDREYPFVELSGIGIYKVARTKAPLETGEDEWSREQAREMIMEEVLMGEV